MLSTVFVKVGQNKTMDIYGIIQVSSEEVAEKVDLYLGLAYTEFQTDA